MMPSEPPLQDTILDEIHRVREQIAAKFNYDIHAILEDARNRQAASERASCQGPPPSKDSA